MRIGDLNYREGKVQLMDVESPETISAFLPDSGKQLHLVGLDKNFIQL
jgi:hypothetical protein